MGLFVDIRKCLSDFDLCVSFQVEDPGEVLALLGASGCGKSMTLKCIAGTERPDSGRIVLGDRVLFDSQEGIDLPPQDRRVGYLFQSYALFPTMTVLENVMVGATGSSKAKRRDRALRELASVHLDGLEGRRPAQLSGGQQQRCAIARILASDAELILLDEPFSALDGYLRWQLEMELTDTLRRFPGGVVYVSHNRDEVYRMCDTVCVMDRGHADPKLGIRELFARPQSLAAALISGCKNVSPATVLGEGLVRCEDWGVTLATSLPLGAGVTHVGIRAHYFHVAQNPSAEATMGATAGVALAGAAPHDATDGVTSRQNVIPCDVDRVIDNTFSTIVMLRTPGGGLLRYELEKEAWARLGTPATLSLTIDPACVMPLEGRPNHA